jgi:hypothetical protein
MKEISINKNQNNADFLNKLGLEELEKHLKRKPSEIDLQFIDVVFCCSMLETSYEILLNNLLILRIRVKETSFNDWRRENSV